MAPANQPEEPDRSQNNAGNDKHQARNPFVNFRRSVDNVAASIFTDLAETFPSLQKFIPPPDKSFFDEWAREAFRRFNDSYERSTNPERKRIERMSCYADGDKLDSKDKAQDLGRRWVDRRASSASQDATSDSLDPRNKHPRAFTGHLSIPSMRRFFEHGCESSPINGHWRPGVMYLLTSPYSPVRLDFELDYLIPEDCRQWQDAFEDLLHLEHGLPMLSLEEKGPRPNNTPREYTERLGRKGFIRDVGTYPFLLNIFGLPIYHVLFKRACLIQPDRPHLASAFLQAQKAFRDLPDDPTPEEEDAARAIATRIANEPPQTELEHYEKWLRHSDEQEPGMLFNPFLRPLTDEDDCGDEQEGERDGADKRHSSRPASSITVTETSEPGILESVCETERRVLPDGSILVHTKVKNKYTDGTEWNDESATLTPAPDVRRESPREERGTNDDPAQEQQSILQAAKEHQKRVEKKKGGWFWSD